MTDAVADALRAGGIEDVQAGVATASLTTLRVGGPLRWLVTVNTDEDLATVGRVCTQHEVPWLVVGRGSNLLVADDGFPGMGVLLGRGFRTLEIDGSTVRVGAAYALPALAIRLADEGLAGFAWASSVPGTVGGAVRMNAGAHGSDMAECLVEVDVVRLCSGARETWPTAVLDLGYRHSALPDDAVVVSATLALRPGDAAELRREVEEIRAWRREHQPLSEPNCGSVFTNPPGQSAGELIDRAGARGLVAGGARVSERHANFIVTRPGATAADVADLIRRVRERVREVHGVDLTPEVVSVGEDLTAPRHG
ncbi:MAG: UDP-N-acetylmuramate dehydrogenase [Nitriliruptoraceae bacterium]